MNRHVKTDEKCNGRGDSKGKKDSSMAHSTCTEEIGLSELESHLKSQR